MKKIIAVAMTVLMLAALAVPSFAEGSPYNPNTAITVTIDTVKGNGDAKKTINDDGTITLIANPGDGDKFEEWILTGEYEIVSGSLTSTTLVIRPKTDVKTQVKFTGKDRTEVDNSGKSPATGTYTVVYVMVAAMAVGVAVVAKKRLAADAD